MTGMFSKANRPIWIEAAFVLVILLVGATINPNILSINYLLQQLQVASFLGIVAAGSMLVILLGHIDLSIPWTITTGGMLATAAADLPATAGLLTLPVGLGVGLLVGLVNGLGVCWLRVPSMIFTLGMNAVLQGLIVLYTGGFAPQNHASRAMTIVAVDHTLGIPNAVFIWAIVSLIIIFLLRGTQFGRYIYAVGNRERAAYLSGVPTRLVIVSCFAISGMTAALAGIMLTGYSTKAYQGMGDAYLLPAIAAIVLGGTNVLGGSGRYIGTIVGVILIVILQSILSVLQIPEAGRQIAYGAVLLGMLLVYGRGARIFE
ncbi:MAG: ABC transporter permease [Verrucomicrobia bacterium]|nr:ABC transporter permease [Verrucomicrobiota bacterium]MBV9671471.1 ABC transporter permease [Verrucomicrobiota bacterium]